MTRLWDYLRGPGRNEIQAWAKQQKLGVRERAQLNQKLDMLERVGFDTACSLEFLAGTSGGYPHIFKLVVRSQRMLRPMLCRGPIEPKGEATLLCGAIEKDFELLPADAARRADENRLRLMDAARLGEERRMPHERF
jgi:hypothetical protein